MMKYKPSEILKKAREKLYSRFEKRWEVNFLEKNAELIDDYFHAAYENSDTGQELIVAGHDFAVVAQGGYGRKEQCIHSDVDILFLFDKAIPDQAEALIQEIIYPLWDIKIDVGYATRTIKDCINLSTDNLEVFTALLDARFLCGRTPLYITMAQRLRAKFTGDKSKKNRKQLIDSFTRRHKSYGDSAYLLEPNLKNGLGGLRDYHALLWLGKIETGLEKAEDLEYKGYISHHEFKALEKSLDMIWKTRNRLHRLTGRKCDHLHYEYQEAIAEGLQYKAKDGQKPVERFMGDLHVSMETVKQMHLMVTEELGNSQKFYMKKNLFKRTKKPGLAIFNNMLCFSAPEKVKTNPHWIIDIFAESARLKLPLNNEAKRIVSKCTKKSTHLGEYKDVIPSFEKLLVTMPYDFNVLDDILSTGFLVRLIPEYDTIINRIQYNQYHIYPVDKHSLHVVQEIKSFSHKKSDKYNRTYARVYADIVNKTTLYWSALLHDIGKGMSDDDHSESGALVAKEILGRFAFERKKIDDIAFIIKNHLFLANIARRRDIDDEETAVFCARNIKTVDRLRMLYILTLADSMSTGPNAWNRWIEGLLQDLFLKTLGVLENRELATVKADRNIEAKKAVVLSLIEQKELDKARVTQCFDTMPPRYILNTTSVDILEHIKMNINYKGSGCITHASKDPNNGRIRYSVFTKDKPGLFSRIAGVFTINGFDILNAQTYSWGSKKALDIFTIKPFIDSSREQEKLHQVEKELNDMVDNNFEPGDNLEINPKLIKRTGTPHRVDIDNNYSSFFTIIEVFADDFPGLLFLLTDTLYKSGLDIRYSKTATHVDQVLDIFYVRNVYGQKIYNQEDIDRIVSAIYTMLENVYKCQVRC